MALFHIVSLLCMPMDMRALKGFGIDTNVLEIPIEIVYSYLFQFRF